VTIENETRVAMILPSGKQVCFAGRVLSNAQLEFVFVARSEEETHRVGSYGLLVEP